MNANDIQLDHMPCAEWENLYRTELSVPKELRDAYADAFADYDMGSVDTYSMVVQVCYIDGFAGLVHMFEEDPLSGFEEELFAIYKDILNHAAAKLTARLHEAAAA